jgi:hypothetical protein
MTVFLDKNVAKAQMTVISTLKHCYSAIAAQT